jgi:hypothetical protein
MTPDERRMIEDLFQRLSQQASPDKDMQADRFINDLMRRNPDAAYMLTQTTLVLEHQMNEQSARIAELEDQLADVQGRGAASSGGSFLGSRIGSQRGSVPPVGAPDEPALSPWGNQPAAGQPSARNQRSSGFQGAQPVSERGGMIGSRQSQPMQQPPQQVPYQPPMQQQPAQGGGFFRSALATAAGVAGGMVLANSLGGLFGGNTAQAAQPGALADANATQDELQDAQLASDAEIDAETDAGDFGGFDSFET